MKQSVNKKQKQDELEKYYEDYKSFYEQCDNASTPFEIKKFLYMCKKKFKEVV
jgi:hypothetical protein